MVHDLQDVKDRIDAIVDRNFNNKVIVKCESDNEEFQITNIECRNNVTIIKVIKI